MGLKLFMFLILATLTSCKVNVRQDAVVQDVYDSVKVFHYKTVTWGDEARKPEVATAALTENGMSGFKRFTIRKSDSLAFISSRIRQAKMDSIAGEYFDIHHNDIIALMYKDENVDTLATDAFPLFLMQFNDRVFKDGLLTIYFTESVMARDSVWRSGYDEYVDIFKRMSYNKLSDVIDDMKKTVFPELNEE